MVEIMVVITIISIMSMIAVPKLTGFFSNKRENLAVLTGLITKTFDDSFLNERINYLIIHLYNGTTNQNKGSMQIPKDVFNRSNGVSIVNLKNGVFIDNNRKIFHYKEFNDSFKIEEVLLTTGEIIQNGNVLIPFYPHGFSDNVIIHLLVNNEEKISIRILKHLKEPKVISGYITYQDNY